MKVELTMRKHAPIITALIFTSRSMGNWIPKLSESVNASLRSPVHCLLIFPILLTSSIVKICGKSCIRKQIVHMCCISVKVIPWTCLVLLEQDHRTAHNSILFFARCHWNLRFVRSIMVISCFSYPFFGSGKRPVSLTQIPFTAQSNKTSWAMEQSLHYATQEHALCSGFIQAMGLCYWKHISRFRARGGFL